MLSLGSQTSPKFSSQIILPCQGIYVKGLPQQAEVAQGVPGRLRPRIFLTFSTMRVVGRQPYAPATFTPGDIPGTHFQELSQPQGTWFHRGEPRKKSPMTPPGINPSTVQLVAQCLNHYTTPDPYRSIAWKYKYPSETSGVKCS